MKNLVLKNWTGLSLIIAAFALGAMVQGGLGAEALEANLLTSAQNKSPYEMKNVPGTYRLYVNTPSIDLKTHTVGAEANEEKVVAACKAALKKAEQIIHMRNAGQIIESIPCEKVWVGFDEPPLEYYYFAQVYYSPTVN